MMTLMRYHLDDINAFVNVVEAGSISAAATRMNLAKSVVSKRITHLEKALGAALLNRSTHGVTPTDEGVTFHARARSILQQLDDAAEEITSTEGAFSGSLRISAPMSFGTLYLGVILAPFLKQHPQLEVNLVLDDQQVDMQSGGYDLAIRIAHLPDSSLIARRLCTIRRIVCCSPDYAAQHVLPQSLDDIHTHACIGYANVRSAQTWRFEPTQAGGEPRSLTVRSRIVANNGEIMRDMAIAGLGIAILPTFIVADALAKGQLIDAMAHEKPTAAPIHAVYTKARKSSRKLQAVITHLQEALANKPPWE